MQILRRVPRPQIDPYTHTEFPGPYASMEDQALYFYGPNYMDVQEPRGHYIHHYHHRSPVNAHHRDYASAEGIPRGLMSWGRGRKDADTHRRDGNPGQHQGWNYESYWVWNSAQRRDGDREFLDPHRGHRRMVPRPVRHIRREIMNKACFL
ncbi:hypothetical protein BJ138DRAFT_1105004 [Hygrophoropsis aurantiaca]|uniref:Uncharacterized protein n=1 Tax=Hygrophoropsis aurantiaca TaxID=72124 RepID=A0ACB7ZZP9_9AGAM|nr:hypothetical protein BJ138DRAFT_1105004 [Hygrophoropsis aurantiaca]